MFRNLTLSCSFLGSAKEISSIQRIKICTQKFPELQKHKQTYIDEDKPNLWFTTLPNTKKRARSLIKSKINNYKVTPVQTGRLSIECKRKEFNHYRGTHYRKLDIVPLASKAWHHYKSKGDYFTILPTSEHPAFCYHADETKINSFRELNVNDAIITELEKNGIIQPTTIQAKAIPHLLKGEHCLLTAETGCGKTLTFLIPTLQHILKIKKNNKTKIANNSPFAIVVLPTRELSIQVGNVARQYCSNLGLNCLTLVGGSAKEILENPTMEPVDLIVTSIGVLLKLTYHKLYFLDNCKIVVIDEADSLLDDSFSNSIRHLLVHSGLKFSPPDLRDFVPNSTQIILSSATKPTSMHDFDFLPVNDLQKISTNYLHKIQPHIPQLFKRVGKSEKPEELLRIVKKCVKENLPTMIFSNKTPTCNFVYQFLKDNGVSAVKVNGMMFARKRLREFEKFKSGAVNIISCTDVSSRGLNCTRIKRVINYDFPKYMADYIHRCGRTGRIGSEKNCKIINFISKNAELPLLHQIEKAARTESTLHNVNNNIKRIIQNRAFKNAQVVLDPEPFRDELSSESESDSDVEQIMK